MDDKQQNKKHSTSSPDKSANAFAWHKDAAASRLDEMRNTLNESRGYLEDVKKNHYKLSSRKSSLQASSDFSSSTVKDDDQSTSKN